MPTFDVHFERGIRPIGVHIRASDRIGGDHPHFMKNEAELRSYMSATIDALNGNRPQHLYICSESQRCRRVFSKHLDRSIKVVAPTCPTPAPPEYVDLFALALCREIWMVSRFSSFAIVAALIGNVPVASFVDDKEVRERYQAEFRYQPMSLKEIVTENILGESVVSRWFAATKRWARRHRPGQ